MEDDPVRIKIPVRGRNSVCNDRIGVLRGGMGDVQMSPIFRWDARV